MSMLQNKTILILSPQSWGKMYVSKHHYAVQLAREGNQVYFLNPPVDKDPVPGKSIHIEPVTTCAGLFLIHHRLYFPYNLKFHFIGLFHFLMKPHIRRILGMIGRPVDVIWSFDLGNLYPFRLFPSRALRIFHPVDEPRNQTAIDSAKGGQVIFSVTREILDKYNDFPGQRHFVNHGVGENFLLPVDVNREFVNPVRVGLSGNFLRSDIDREVLLQIVRENPKVVFECWGSYASSQSNLAGSSDENTEAFIRELQAATNVILHGSIGAEKLARELHRMDAFLICYDIEKDQSKGTNYHKIMEYLSTGKVIISNNVTTYKEYPELIQMVEERDNNRNLPVLFREVISNLQHFNSPQLQERRIGFSRDNTYSRQIGRIGQLLESLL